jgi:hypothetical protein
LRNFADICSKLVVVVAGRQRKDEQKNHLNKYLSLVQEVFYAIQSRTCGCTSGHRKRHGVKWCF